MEKYSILISYSASQYIATVPELPGVRAYADTRAEALREAITAIGETLKMYERKGLKAPPPAVI